MLFQLWIKVIAGLLLLIAVLYVLNSIEVRSTWKRYDRNRRTSRIDTKADYTYRIACSKCGEVLHSFLHEGNITCDLLSEGYLPTPDQDSNGNYIRVQPYVCDICLEEEQLEQYYSYDEMYADYTQASTDAFGL
jgi:hypothetical protein